MLFLLLPLFIIAIIIVIITSSPPLPPFFLPLLLLPYLTATYFPPNFLMSLFFIFSTTPLFLLFLVSSSILLSLSCLSPAPPHYCCHPILAHLLFISLSFVFITHFSLLFFFLPLSSFFYLFPSSSSFLPPRQSSFLHTFLRSMIIFFPLRLCYVLPILFPTNIDLYPFFFSSPSLSLFLVSASLFFLFLYLPFIPHLNLSSFFSSAFIFSPSSLLFCFLSLFSFFYTL